MAALQNLCNAHVINYIFGILSYNADDQVMVSRKQILKEAQKSDVLNQLNMHYKLGIFERLFYRLVLAAS